MPRRSCEAAKAGVLLLLFLLVPVETTNAAGVTIYVIGTGVRITHQDFGGRASYAGDFCTGHVRTGSLPFDTADGYDGHDTHVASYAAGARYGVAPAARIVALRTTWYESATDPANGGPDCQRDRNDGAVAAAFAWVIAHGRKPGVINYSGGHGDLAVRRTILDAVAAGFVVTLSGNTGGDVRANWGSGVPAKALVVGATDADGNALNKAADYGPLLALFAVGQGRTGAGRASDDDYSIPDNDSACRCGGDSFAAPVAAGAAALYLETHPGAAPAEVRKAVVDSAQRDGVRNNGSAPNRWLRSSPPYMKKASRERGLLASPQSPAPSP